MREETQLLIAFLTLALLTMLAVIGTIVTSPVMGIFALVFLLASAVVLVQLWRP